MEERIYVAVLVRDSKIVKVIVREHRSFTSVIAHVHLANAHICYVVQERTDEIPSFSDEIVRNSPRPICVSSQLNCDDALSKLKLIIVRDRERKVTNKSTIMREKERGREREVSTFRYTRNNKKMLCPVFFSSSRSRVRVTFFSLAFRKEFYAWIYATIVDDTIGIF